MPDCRVCLTHLRVAASDLAPGNVVAYQCYNYFDCMWSSSFGMDEDPDFNCVREVKTMGLFKEKTWKSGKKVNCTGSYCEETSILTFSI